METFEQAKTKFEEQLRKNGRSSKIVWIFREKVSQIKTATFFYIGNEKENEDLARMVYERGLKIGLGISFTSQFYTHEHTVAYVWHPKHEEDAMEHLQGRCLKIRIIEKAADPKVFKEIEIKNKIMWRFWKWLEDEDSPYQSVLDDMPKKDGSIRDRNEGKRVNR
jgi:hypothetical protein